MLTVEEQGYEEAVVKNMAKEISILLPDTIRGMNASLEEVRDKLDLVSEVKGSKTNIRYYLLFFRSISVFPLLYFPAIPSFLHSGSFLPDWLGTVKCLWIIRSLSANLCCI